jgi:hypothetical protein
MAGESGNQRFWQILDCGSPPAGAGVARNAARIIQRISETRHEQIAEKLCLQAVQKDLGGEARSFRYSRSWFVFEKRARETSTIFASRLSATKHTSLFQ